MLMLARKSQIIDCIWQYNTKQAKMPDFHCSPSRFEKMHQIRTKGSAFNIKKKTAALTMIKKNLTEKTNHIIDINNNNFL